MLYYRCKEKEDLEIRYPERGRKYSFRLLLLTVILLIFGNKIPREGTEITIATYHHAYAKDLEIRYPERGRKFVSQAV